MTALIIAIVTIGGALVVAVIIWQGIRLSKQLQRMVEGDNDVSLLDIYTDERGRK